MPQHRLEAPHQAERAEAASRNCGPKLKREEVAAMQCAVQDRAYRLLKRHLHVTSVAGIAAFLVSASSAQAPPVDPSRGQSILTDLRRDYGQNIAPVFEGWEPNADGTISMYFGYMNRNWKEELDIPIGPDNFFEPAPQDRGQPTHFLPRRHKQTFSIIVPKNFPVGQSLVWTLSVRGKTERVPGSLKATQQIDVSRETASGNRRPQIDVGQELMAAVGQPLTLRVSYSDDGVPKRRPQASPAGQPPNILAGPNVRWSKYRGPGMVTFGRTLVPVEEGQATTTASFDQQGVYWIQALADDGSVLGQSQGQNVPGFSCCWTTGIIRVTVK
jgi:hypothetical protein